MSGVEGTVHIVDDDAEVAASLRSFFEAHCLQSRTHHSAEEFLAEPEPEPGCLVVDLRMPGLSGIGLIERLAREHRLPPTIVLTAHGDVPAAVRAMKLGAIDFFMKPHDSDRLLEVVEQALGRAMAERKDMGERIRLLDAAASLTPREQDVLRGLVEGRSSREIAASLGLRPKSVDIYRGRVLAKFGFTSSLELVCTLVRLCPELTRGHKAAQG